MKKIFYILFFAVALTASASAQSSLQPDQALASSRFVKFYPNPATANINFDFLRGHESSYSLLIFNFMGKKVFEIKNTPSRMNINLDDFYRGIYVFQLRDKNGQILESGKFQVVK